MNKRSSILVPEQIRNLDAVMNLLKEHKDMIHKDIQDYMQMGYNDIIKLLNRLVEDKYLTYEPDVYSITSQAYSFVGYEQSYVSEKEKEALEREKLSYDVKNAKRIFKTYWWTFVMALIAFLFTVYTFLKNLLVPEESQLPPKKEVVRKQ